MKKSFDIFPIHSGDTEHTKLITMNTETGDHPQIAQNHLYIHTKLIREEQEN